MKVHALAGLSHCRLPPTVCCSLSFCIDSKVTSSKHHSISAEVFSVLVGNFLSSFSFPQFYVLRHTLLHFELDDILNYKQYTSLSRNTNLNFEREE